MSALEAFGWVLSVTALGAVVTAFAVGLAAARLRCPRERLGYRCHAHYEGGCEMCGRVGG